MILRFAMAAAVIGFAAGVSAQEAPPAMARVSTVQGEVLVSHGAEISPAQEGSVLAAGDRLMALDDAQALIAFADGCETILAGESMVTIGERSECLKSTMRPRKFRQAIGETGGGTDRNNTDGVTTVNSTDGTNSGLTVGQQWLVAAAVVIPIVYYYDNRHNHDNRPPVSQ